MPLSTLPICTDRSLSDHVALTAADEQRTPWPAVLPGTGSKSASGREAAETTPAGSLQQPGSGLHAGQSAYGGGSTGQRTTPWSGASARPQDYSVPRFHEMEVSRSLLLNPPVLIAADLMHNIHSACVLQGFVGCTSRLSCELLSCLDPCVCLRARTTMASLGLML